MKPFSIKGLLLVVLLLTGVACGQSTQTSTDTSASSAPNQVSEPNKDGPKGASKDWPVAPAWQLADADGRLVTFGGPRERPAVLLFWASWCPFCKQLMPHLQSIVDEQGERIDVLALNISDDADPVAFLQEYGYQFQLIPEADSVAAAYGVKGTPGLFLIDSDGLLRYNLYEVEVDKQIPTDIKRWQKAARLAPLWSAELRKAIDRL